MYANNPDKFQAIAVGKKTYPKESVFNIESANISCDEVVKLLGIDLDFQLNFDKHIKNICLKASTQLSVLKRIGCVFFYLSLISLISLTIFHTFILSNVNFCPLDWHFVQNQILLNSKKYKKELYVLSMKITIMKNFDM